DKGHIAGTINLQSRVFTGTFHNKTGPTGRIRLTLSPSGTSISGRYYHANLNETAGWNPERAPMVWNMTRRGAVPKVSTPALAKRRFISDEWIEVIPLIDPQLDKWDVPQRTGKNAWRMEEGELVVGGDALASKLLLPLDSDWPAFECELEFTRRVGNAGLNVNLPTQQGECPLFFGVGGVHLGSSAKGMLMAKGTQLATGQRTTMRVEVRRQQEADQVSVAFNGAIIGEWTGDLKAISDSYHEGFPHDRRVSLWIHPGGNEFVFHRIRIRMLDGGTAETLRPVPSAPQFVTPLLAIAPFDATQARKHQEVWAKHLGVPVEYTNSLDMKFVLIPPGEFMMGSTDDDAAAQPIEKPQHKVRLTQPILMGVHEVTVGQFRTFIEATGYKTEAEASEMGADYFDSKQRKLIRSPDFTWAKPPFEQSADDPVCCVTWIDAQKFCEWLSREDGRTYVLPTEAQWEFACRAGTSTRTSFGDKPGFTKTKANAFFQLGRTCAVGSYAPNAFGLYDMCGNVYEWCQDDLRTYGSESAIDPTGPVQNPPKRANRGGGYSSNIDKAGSPARNAAVPTSAYAANGFR
ncbi:MAG: formylglycine-generating enzyme family protein, partial [Planctomycetaceae bacterium]|nr:formylglycine-generating enzyme family protein [Planctomycetaceae bacterium]